ncbi:MAG: lytic transglycosylase, partial [Bacteroidota bacterium]
MRKIWPLIFLLAFVTGFSQVAQDSLVVKESQKDSIIDGKILSSTQIKPEVTDSIPTDSLQDLELTAEFERKWLEELYENSLYDT